jgi:hypothetical protein
MPGPSILSPQQLDEFDRRGVLRLNGLLPANTVRRALVHVQRRLARLGPWKHGAWCLSAYPRPTWPASGLKTSKEIGNDHPDVSALVDEPAVIAVAEALVGGCAIDRAVAHAW